MFLQYNPKPPCLMSNVSVSQWEMNRKQTSQTNILVFFFKPLSKPRLFMIEITAEDFQTHPVCQSVWSRLWHLFVKHCMPMLVSTISHGNTGGQLPACNLSWCVSSNWTGSASKSGLFWCGQTDARGFICPLLTQKIVCLLSCLNNNNKKVTYGSTNLFAQF